MFENPRRGRQRRNFTKNVPKILDLKSSSEQIFFRKLSLGAPEIRSDTGEYEDLTRPKPGSQRHLLSFHPQDQQYSVPHSCDHHLYSCCHILIHLLSPPEPNYDY